MHVLAAAGALGLKRLIFPSLTALYGARPNGPALITEATLLAGCPGSRFINDKVEVENQLHAFRTAHPLMQVLVLRFAPIVGPTSDNPITRWLRTRIVPTLLGFDPLWQVLHEEDAADALHAALFTEAAGAFNVAADGVLMEKYDVDDPGIRAEGGEYEVQEGFGWTNGVYVALNDTKPGPA